MEAIIIAQWTQLRSDYKMWNHSISMRTGRYWHQSFWNYGLFSSPAEVPGFFQHQVHVKEIVCIPEAPLDVLKFELWFVIANLLPQKAMILLALENDDAYTSLIGHSATKSALLVLLWCHKATGDREQDVWRYWLPECCFKQCCDKLRLMVASTRSVGWGSNETVTSCISYLIQVCWCAVWKHMVQKHFWSMPLTRIYIGVADSSVLPLLLLRSLSILSGCHINICFGNQDMKLWWIGPMAYHPHTKFHYSKLLT